ncbi:hypothetical protein EB118_04815 [bacterium]|nr:hypothetical protein [bacterium]NDC94159.1 hypothetical protein [bacterium]NDD82757.1 hypothetical protein [bacterium]NDG29408.1 hypothetical protein [bacterium]
MKLVYVHIGTEIPECLVDSIYQTLLVCGGRVKIYVILHDTLVEDFNKKITEFNLDTFLRTKDTFINLVQTIPIGIIEHSLLDNVHFNKYKNAISNKYTNQFAFRNGFWISTTSRFFYIYGLMSLFKLENLYHIENDVMLYDYLDFRNPEKITVVKDAPGRVIPCLLHFPNAKLLGGLVSYIAQRMHESTQFLNDMELIGSYSETVDLSIFPNDTLKVYDGAAVGQYLGGVDLKNLKEYQAANGKDKKLMEFMNPSVHFVNETSVIKPDKMVHIKTNVMFDHSLTGLRVFMMRSQGDTKYNTIQNLHIHSKQLYQFSSVMTTGFGDIISGDRITSLADFVILTSDILQFHQGIKNYAKDIMLIRDFNNVNIKAMTEYFAEFCKTHDTDTIKLFVYTHILKRCTEEIFSKLQDKFNFILYLHNSDHPFDISYSHLVDSKNIKHIYAQNVTYPVYNKKITLLPIGIANAMWPHGDLISLYDTLRRTYKNRKSKSVYVNINPGTYGYRREFLEAIKRTGCLEVYGSKAYPEYLEELSQHRFCLCLRGNGVDTHRFWEAVYLGVIPIIVNNSATKMDSFVKYLEQLDIPFYEIKKDSLEAITNKYTERYFNENLYRELAISKGNGIFNLNALKLDYYTAI